MHNKFDKKAIEDIRKSFIRDIQKLAAEKYDLLLSINNIQYKDEAASFRAKLFIMSDYGIPWLPQQIQYQLNQKAIAQGLISSGENIYGREFFSPDDNLWMVIGLYQSGSKPYQLLNLKDNRIIRANADFIRSGVWLTDIEEL